jgi:hypothetical protein
LTNTVEAVTVCLHIGRVWTPQPIAEQHFLSRAAANTTQVPWHKRCADAVTASGKASPTAPRRIEHTKDVVAMPLNRQHIVQSSRRGRPSSPSCRGGASSLLRLAQPANPRLPTAVDLSGWMHRAARVLGPSVGLQAAFAASDFNRNMFSANA